MIDDVVLSVGAISKSFGALRAITDLSFQLDRCEVLGLIGPNGAGKTTAINVISGLVRADSGRVVLQGRDVTTLRPHRLTRLGLVRTFQATNVYQSCTVRENLYRGAFVDLYRGFWPVYIESPNYRHGRTEVEHRIEALLDEVGLRSVAGTLAIHLPYGHQKVLGLAIALASRPKVVLLDEPAAGLSAEEADRVAGVIRRLSQSSVGVVIVDHNMRFISSLCHRVAVLHHGTELVSGTPAEVIRHPKVIEAYLGSEHAPA